MDIFKFVAANLAVVASLLLSTVVATSTSPCAAFASSYADYFAKEPESDGMTASMPADIVYECISTVPLQKEYSEQLIGSLWPWLELASQIDYLNKPLSGYLWDPVDIFEELNRIYEDVHNNKYASQYNVEVDIQTLFLYFHDAHTTFQGGLITDVTWTRTIGLVTVSADGIELPKVYVFSDLVEVDDEDNFHLSTSTNVSPLDAINGIPVQEFLQTQQLVAYSHDPDAMYNALANNVRLPYFSTFLYPTFYPGPETTLRFENGSIVSFSNKANVKCQIPEDMSTGQAYWEFCILGPLLNATEESTSSSAAESEPRRPAATTRLPSHPQPIRIDNTGTLSGYYLDGSGYEDIAVLLIKGFDSDTDPNFMRSFQDTLESFLDVARTRGKTRLIIDMQGNEGGFVDLGTELVAQLFPNIPPTQKGNYRASAGLSVVLKKIGDIVEFENRQDQNDAEEVLINEASYATYNPWQFIMTPNGTPFSSFDDFYGPYETKNHGNFTTYFQSNYSNTNPFEFMPGYIQITGYGTRLLPVDTPPPFDAEDIVILSDGACASTCSIVIELLTNLHSVPTIAVGGRPVKGPMQAVGNTKGSLIFTKSVLDSFYGFFNNNTEPAADRSVTAGTIFENWNNEALLYGLENLNAMNNYRIDDESESVLQMVYGAADCKMWYTAEMLVDPTAIWKRAADIAFDPDRKRPGAAGGPYSSEYCVKDSTGHSSSVTGGLKRGQLGDQTPPKKARPQYIGWLKNGTEIVQGFSIVTHRAAGDGAKADSTSSDEDQLTDAEMQAGLADLKILCNRYSGDKWMFSLICNVLG